MKEKHTDEINKPGPEPKKRPKNKRYVGKRFKNIIIGLSIILLIPVAYGGYVFASSPSVIRNPKIEHYHFRMQVLVDGNAENFAEQKYQTGYAKDQCNAALPEQPIHFHDNKDQFTHIHWEGMTGGMVMKYYGWNFIGGISSFLGYKLDKLTEPQKVTTHGNYLPAIPKDAKFYIYAGDENGYTEKSFNDWKNQDLEQFFGKTSNSPVHEQNKKTSFIDQLFPGASAHGSENTAPVEGENEQERLARINNLLGNVVIFVQNDKPTDRQIKDRFSKLEPLTESTCGG